MSSGEESDNTKQYRTYDGPIKSNKVCYNCGFVHPGSKETRP